MKLIFASDSFKGTLSSAEICTLLEKAAKEVYGESNVNCIGLPVADGGEGTVDAVLAAKHGERIKVQVHGPLMEEREAFYGCPDPDHAIMEMAAASGLTLVPEELRNPLNTTSFGVGEMILDALNRGIRDITIAIGGSATNDGGMGCLTALGVKLQDESGNPLDGKGMNLERVRNIDLSGLDPGLRKHSIIHDHIHDHDPSVQDIKLTIMCDVTNPLCGVNGATRVYGPQKGGTPEMIERLEQGMQNYRDVIRKELGVDADTIPGSGAAGGLGAALSIFLGGQIRSGIDTVLDLIDFDKHLADADLVITGEGRADAQSCCGKVLQGVGKRAKAAGIPVIGLCGSLGEGAEKLLDHGITKLLTTSEPGMPLEEAMCRAEELYYRSAVRMFKEWGKE